MWFYFDAVNNIFYSSGSSVSTSLVEGESMNHPKGMGMLEIKQKKFRLKSIPYTQIRPFIYADMSLQDIPGLDPVDPKIEEKIKDVLTKRVLKMIKEARESVHVIEEAYPNRLQYRISSPEQVLVRLRVEHMGFPAVHQQRFGSQFVGSIANPSDLLLFSKKKRDLLNPNNEGNIGNTGRKSSNIMKGMNNASDDVLRLLENGQGGDLDEQIKVEDLVNETLATSNRSLSVLVEEEIAQVKNRRNHMSYLSLIIVGN